MSTIKVNKIEKRTGSTLTLGGACTAVTLACGATQTGFGRTGTVDWCTTAKTSPLTAENGKGYFINTTCGAVTVTLPGSPSQGDIVAIKDYASTWDTNAVTLGRNGSKINGVCGCSTLESEGQSITLVYVDGTKGWQDVQDSSANVQADTFISATGGTVTTVCTNYKVHTFTGDGNFVVSSGQGAKAFVSYLVVAGGGGGAGRYGGGGGGGGMREGRQNTTALPDTYTAFPNAATSGIPISPGTHAVVVGAGGDRAPSNPPNAEGTPGDASSFSTITSAGGARGGGQSGTGCRNGGSGGGGSYGTSGIGAAGTGNTPPVNPPQGFPGGTGSAAPLNAMGGGGGATEAGQAGSGPPNRSGRGGAGGTTNIPGSPISKAGGGGGASSTPESIASGAASPCGTGTAGATGPGSPASCAAANSGGGGGGGNYISPPDSTQSGKGGSGIVVIRYKFQ
jgi:hypothetical protein